METTVLSKTISPDLAQVKIKSKKLLGYLAFILLIAFLAGYSWYLFAHKNLSVEEYKPGGILLFIILGTGNILLLKKVIPFVYSNTGNHITVSLLAGLMVSIALFFLNGLMEANLNVIADACAFLVPVIISGAWNTFWLIPQKKYKDWYANGITGNKPVPVFLNCITMQIQLKKKQTSAKEQVFIITAPGHSKLGDAFEQMIASQNAANENGIDINDRNDKPYAWEFIRTDLSGYRKIYLDPEATFTENNLRENMQIYAVRKQVKRKV